MANQPSLCFLFFSFLILFQGNNAFSAFSGTKFLQKSKISKPQIQIRRTLQDTNPASTSPTIITVPSTNPGATNLVPSTIPPTNPANSPVPVTNPVTAPVTVPVSSYPPPSPLSGTVPGTTPQFQPPPSNINPPPSNINPPPSSSSPGGGGSWCVAKAGVSQTTLQTALDYACGTNGADCSQIQQGGICYNPNSLQNHASFAFNSYYVKNPASTSCDFGGVATIVTTNPSTGTCVFPSASGAAGSSGSGSNSPSIGFGGPSTSPDSSHSTGLRPLLSFMILMTLLASGRLASP